MPLPTDYAERVYAGVLGKLVGVYLGRPFEGWTYERIMAELGEIQGYVHERLGAPLIVTDDDITGTFSFLRALPDHGNSRQLTPAQIGQTWLNYIIERRTILWWGGLGNSTEHTAYLRLKNGIAAPHSGSMALNGKVVAEQIGAQIFIDGWAMASPGDPQQAADFARRAASVSHDGEAIYGAQVLAAMEAQAFVESDLQRLLDTALHFIPHDSVIYRLTNDLREWRAEFADWRVAREQVAARYGYDQFGGNCHIVPNHALIHLGLLYGDDDFQKSLMITNTSGWDTDCNSGNVGCLLGIKNGLSGLAGGSDWRGPIADRLYLSSAEGGRGITDAVTEAYHIINIGRALVGEAPLAPKNGARFHFSLPGSAQGFGAEDASRLTIENADARGLALRYRAGDTDHPARAATPTFIPEDAIHMPGYELYASPTLYPGQTVRAALEAGANGAPVTVGLYLRYYGVQDRLINLAGPQATLAPGRHHTLEWRIPSLDGAPVAEVGIEISAAQRSEGMVYLDFLTWDGSPEVVFKRPAVGGDLWRRAWVDALDHFDAQWPEAFRLVQDRGLGLLIQGTGEWADYEVSTRLTPHLAKSFGVAARVQGLRRFYALVIGSDHKIRLTKVRADETTLAEADCALTFGEGYELCLRVAGTRLRAYLNGQLRFDVTDMKDPLRTGGVALLCEEGRIATESVSVRPIPPE